VRCKLEGRLNNLLYLSKSQLVAKNTKKMSQKYKAYNIHCGKCDKYILTYHKYGSGKGILRLYFKNIIAPTEWSNLQATSIKEAKPLQCTSCLEVLGSPIISKGKKGAYRMRRGYFHRKLQKK